MQAPIKLPKAPGWLGEFTGFIMRGNVVDLAVGIIIGAAFTAIVNSLVKDLFTPILGLILGGIDFTNLFITLKGTHAATLAAAKAAGAVTLNIGLFLNACISFLIVSFAIFWLIKVINRFMAEKKEEAPAVPTLSEQTLLEIRDLLARHETTAVPKTTEPPV
jgi:large conductance mechanosensitive channel